MGVTSSCKYVNVGSRKENILHWQLKNKARNLNLFFKSHFYQMNSHMYVKNVVIIYKTLNSNLLNFPYYNFERNRLVNKLNNIGVGFELETLLRGKIKYFDQMHFLKMFNLTLNIFIYTPKL